MDDRATTFRLYQAECRKTSRGFDLHNRIYKLESINYNLNFIVSILEEEYKENIVNQIKKNIFN